MDDQGTNREGNGVRRGFRMSLGRLFFVMFCRCVFLGALSWLVSRGERLYSAMDQLGPAAGMRQDRAPSLLYAVMVSLLFAAPCFAILSLFSGLLGVRDKPKK